MFNRNKYTDDELRDFEKYEEYERRKQERIIKGTGNLLYRYFINGFIFITSYILISVVLLDVFKFHLLLSGLVAIISSLIIIFKVEYIKLYPFKSLAVLVFLNFIVMLAFDIR